jgi:hypothetical protein
LGLSGVFIAGNCQITDMRLACVSLNGHGKSLGPDGPRPTRAARHRPRKPRGDKAYDIPAIPAFRAWPRSAGSSAFADLAATLLSSRRWTEATVRGSP